MSARVLVCDPRKNALLKVGNKSDRIDARKLSELLYLNKLSPVYHGEPGIRTAEGTGPQLPGDDARFDAGDESAESHLPELGYSLRRASRCTHRAIVRNGSRRSQKSACAVVPNSTTSSSTP